MSYLPVIEESDVIDGLSIGYLKYYGVWKVIRDYRATGKRNAIIKIKLFITLLLTFTYIICNYISYFYINYDLEKATFLNFHTLPHIQVCCKMLVFWFRLRSQIKLFDLVKKDFLSVPDCKRSAVDEIYNKIAKESNVLCIASFFVNVSIMFVFIFFPEVPVDYILYHTGDMKAVTTGKKKMMAGWYPLPFDKSPFYEIIFSYELILMVWGASCLAIYICLFYQVLMCLYAQFAVLGYHLSTLKLEPGLEKYSSTRKNKSSIHKELLVIINDHQRLLSYAEELRSVYNPLVTIILGMGILFLVLTTFQFASEKSVNPWFIFKFLQTLAFQVIDVSMFCIGSSNVETASSDLQFAIYSSDWYKADIKFRKAAQMMMIRSRKGETLTAIRMYPVNVQTMMSIFQFTYSMATLMSRMND